MPFKWKEYSFIKDQYFRAPIINEAITKQMNLEADLLLIVVTQQLSSLDPRLQYTYLSQQFFQDNFPDRFILIQLMSSSLILEDGIIWDDTVYYWEPILFIASFELLMINTFRLVRVI